APARLVGRSADAGHPAQLTRLGPIAPDGSPALASPSRMGNKMAEVLLFHHAQGLTSGVRAFADRLRAAGHTVHTPDLYDGRTFDDLDDGVANAGTIGFGNILEAGVRAADDLPDGLVYAGFSL